MLVFLRNVCAEEIKGIPMYSTTKMKKEKMTKKERGVIRKERGSLRENCCFIKAKIVNQTLEKQPQYL